jgi:hypothetical protein
MLPDGRKERRRLILLRAVVPLETFCPATAAGPDLPLATCIVEYQKPVDLAADTVCESEPHGAFAVWAKLAS